MKEQELLADRYQLHGLLGCGGMAEVYDGWDNRLGRAVAVKLLRPGMAAQSDVRARFESEARAAAPLAHPNIVAIYDYGEHDGAPFIVMERLPGQTLADVMDRGSMPPDLVRRMLDEVLSALGTAHTAGILHRDIKPANILLSRDGGSLKVADFGIAKTGGAAHTMTGQIIGTMAYMSPARISGAPASVADDLYAVGLMGFEALAGRSAFPHDNPAALARAIMDDRLPSAMSLGADPGLAAVIDGAIAGNFTSAAQMQAALAGARPATRVLDQPLPDMATQLVQQPRPRLTSRTRKTLAAAGITTAAVVSALAFALDTGDSTPAPEPVSTSTTLPAPAAVVPPATVTPVSEPAPLPVVEGPAGGKKPGNGNNGKQGHGQGKKGD
ncbi:serine/threonine protein kinase [Mycobacterium sp. MS1601]|uniref:serine/threonine-protein kinase n=1 Tax=Mycobacterium sp. MS1601 TaxID=1936029 RepID=UPI00097955DC|nr:serine/threonine-protein kinase [Mycobacterium sp. MS1601]AQA04609.1 serine/threonine protein kinase [Mycobacterium sp. MS1601]